MGSALQQQTKAGTMQSLHMLMTMMLESMLGKPLYLHSQASQNDRPAAMHQLSLVQERHS